MSRGTICACRSLLAAGIVMTLPLAGCTGEPRATEAPASATEREEIRQALERYLPVLAEAYASGNVELLRPYAVERVLAQVQKRVADLLAQGLVAAPQFESLEIEELTTWGNDFAMVTTLETWDVTYRSSGSGTVVSSRPGSRSRVRYQLKKVDERWTVFHRELKQELDE
ncbi:MAG TPA: IMS domain-containing protein [Thermoanaerobaculia bacterium]|nr:IMS domain-containing protein [Thermoanaerobaculia bacterium]